MIAWVKKWNILSSWIKKFLSFIFFPCPVVLLFEGKHEKEWDKKKGGGDVILISA